MRAHGTTTVSIGLLTWQRSVHLTEPFKSIVSCCYSEFLSFKAVGCSGQLLFALLLCDWLLQRKRLRKRCALPTLMAFPDLYAALATSSARLVGWFVLSFCLLESVGILCYHLRTNISMQLSSSFVPPV